MSGGARFLPALAAVLGLIAPTVAAEDLLKNPGAEESAPFAAYPEKEAFFGLRATSVPPGWGAYCGGGSGEWGVTDKEARSGKRAAFLRFDKWQTGANGARFASMALLLGEGNGYSGRFAIPVKPSATYRFSFWAKGDVPIAKVSATLFSDGPKGETRQHVVPLLRENGFPLKYRLKIAAIFLPSAQWTRYDGTFETRSDTRRANVSIGFDAPPLLAPGQTLYVDDATLTAEK